MDNKLKVIGLTGGLASGKSTAAQMFAALGAEILDADKIGHKALAKNSRCYKKIVERFGDKILDCNRKIDRSNLAQIAFKNSANQKALCAIIHPWIFEYIDKKIKFYRKNKNINLLIVEAVLLIESGLHKKMDGIIVVKADKSQQISRVNLNRKMNKNAARQRMRYQLSLVKKIKYADYLIDNRGTFKNTESQVNKLAAELLKS